MLFNMIYIYRIVINVTFQNFKQFIKQNKLRSIQQTERLLPSPITRISSSGFLCSSIMVYSAPNAENVLAYTSIGKQELVFLQLQLKNVQYASALLDSMSFVGQSL
jgi:hypothetical protein